jgi:CheY-like chemotaxis protein
MSEKRQFPRFELKAPIKFKVPTQKMDISMASIKNISGGGLCLLVNQKVAFGQMLQVEFVLPHDKTNVIAMCEVVWVDVLGEESEGGYKYQLGIKFVEIDKQQQKAINRFVVHRLKARVREELQQVLPAQKESRRQKILVVDDDKVTLGMVKEVFSDEFDVITAHDGHEGIEKAREWRPDIILLDIIMPDMDGFSTLMLLKDIEETRDIPVMMFSVVREKSKIFQAIRDGAQDFILKPFTPENLLVKIRKTLYNQ